MKYVVYGLGISGISTAKFLARKDENVVATDDNDAGTEAAKKKLIDEKNIKFQKPNEIEYDSQTTISFAPGIPLYFPKPHKILEICKKTGADLACDIEIFYRKNSQKKFIAITGTNGKSTTTALTGFVFKDLGISSEVGGNIGVPCFDLPDVQNYVFETSSYQLDLLSKSHFKIAALLNITPDHIDRHGSMEGYISAKKRIFRNQTESDFAIIDVDNENSHRVFEELKNDKNFKATLIPVSTKKIQENGVALFGHKLVNKIDGANSELEIESEFLKGEHNDQNMAFAFAISYCHFLQQSQKTQNNLELRIIDAIKKFKGLEHRMQIIGKIGDIKFINDSKATNAESTENALKSYNNIFWILGGKQKEGGIEILTPYFKKITKAYLIGEATEEFAKTLEKNSVNFEKCGDLKNAVTKAFFDAKNIGLSQKNILLSPACASFDQFKNFEERGNYFHKLFDELSKSQKTA
jgi:UDP-N-acetylmuramoylalanine--D-glutamate ligase